MFNKDKDTITYTYNMSFICSVWLICFNTSSYDICSGGFREGGGGGGGGRAGRAPPPKIRKAYVIQR